MFINEMEEIQHSTEKEFVVGNGEVKGLWN
jgi:hypothetical protein